MSFVFSPLQKNEVILNSIGLILGFIYIWSGIQKLNHEFLFVTYPWLIEPLTNLVPESISSGLNATHFIAPLVEISGGIGLLFKKTKRKSALLLILMHVFILTMIGPFWHNTNPVVWPWNITFSILLGILFLVKSNLRLSHIFRKRIFSYQLLILLLFGIVPTLSFFNSWPMFFSSALYSGNKVKSEVYIPDQLKERLPTHLKSKVQEVNNALRLNLFVEEEMNVPVYPSTSFHIKTFKNLCGAYPEFELELVLVTYSKPEIFTGERTSKTYFCDEIN